METEALGKVLPDVLLPYLQQWAERSELTLLSRLLGDEQFRGLIEKYGVELMTLMTDANSPVGSKPGDNATDAGVNELTDLQDRVAAMEAQQEVQQALFELLRSKIRPIALALGCCPECLVGMVGCLKCKGRGKVAYYPPDHMLLESQIGTPLAVRGVRLIFSERNVSGTGREGRETTTTTKGANNGHRNDRDDRERSLGK
ncbi:MAG: hypothetical protein A4E19_03310 [Nitrospira sp. SG-bin1]|nr:MAG: hypothetical protein A4E19_03310 [Nitrospira sp. SG-bin1]